MANAQMGPVDSGFVDKRRGRDHGTQTITELQNMGKVSDMRTRLSGMSAYFTSARLDLMTTNDMVYALRINGTDAAGI